MKGNKNCAVEWNMNDNENISELKQIEWTMFIVLQ